MLDARRRYSCYRSDIVDGLNLQCLATIVFLYFACITPIVTFGGMLGKTTDGCMVSIHSLADLCQNSSIKIVSSRCFSIADSRRRAENRAAFIV